MVKKVQEERLLNPKIYRYLVNIWTLILYLAVLEDFLTRNSFDEFLTPICAIYVALLAIYTAEKEFERWHNYHIGRHPGEIYIFIWTMMVIILFILEFIYRESYVLPTEVSTTYVVVIGILAITRKSKSTYLSKKKK